MNEEEVKIRVIVPWLLERGLATEDLAFETSFTLRIGNNSVVIGGRTEKDAQRARLDLLVRRRGANLLVIEVKEPGHSLTDEDRDQAISYARLLHPIAPFALVTNGKDFYLYDVVTKNRLTPETTNLTEG